MGCPARVSGRRKPGKNIESTPRALSERGPPSTRWESPESGSRGALRVVRVTKIRWCKGSERERGGSAISPVHAAAAASTLRLAAGVEIPAVHAQRRV